MSRLSPQCAFYFFTKVEMAKKQEYLGFKSLRPGFGRVFLPLVPGFAETTLEWPQGSEHNLAGENGIYLSP